MNHPWSMQISLRLGEHGWTDLDLWLGDKHHEFCITHIFNSPLDEIADAILSLQKGATESTFSIREEPGEHIWTMIQIPDNRHLLLVAIRSFEDTFEGSIPPFEITEFQVARDFFIGSFLAEFDKLAFQLRHPRFAKNRDAEHFPWDTLREVQRDSKNQANKSCEATGDNVSG